MSFPALKDSAPLRYFTFFYLYVMQGIPAGFALTAIANYLTGQAVSSAVVGSFVAVVGLPWVVQFVWGPFIDRYQFSVIGHRKHWVLLTQVAAFAASLLLLLVQNPTANISLLSALFFAHSIFASVQDASVDAMAIAVVPERERGRMNAFMRGGFLLGISFGAAGLSYVLHRYDFRTAVLVQSGMLLFFSLLTFVIKLDRHDPLLPRLSKTRSLTTDVKNPAVRQLFRSLWTALSARRSLQLFTVIALVYLSFSIFIRSFSYHIINVEKWPDRDLSVLQGGWGSLATFCVILGGGVIADKIGARNLQTKVMWVLALFLVLFNALSFMWSVKSVTVSGLLFWSVADPLFSVAAFPILMSLCRDVTAGSQFTAYMAFINFCDVLGSAFAGWAMRWVGASVLGFACGLLLFVGIYFLSNFKGESEKGFTPA